MTRYKIVRGVHVDRAGRHTAQDNPYVESEQNLLKRYPGRFVLAPESSPAQVAPSPNVAQAAAQAFEQAVTSGVTEPPPDLEVDLERMSVKQLREFAAQHDIDVTDCNGKQEHLNVIRAALDAA